MVGRCRRVSLRMRAWRPLVCHRGPAAPQVRLFVRRFSEAAIERRRTGFESAAAVQHVVQVHMAPERIRVDAGFDITARSTRNSEAGASAPGTGNVRLLVPKDGSVCPSRCSWKPAPPLQVLHGSGARSVLEEEQRWVGPTAASGFTAGASSGVFGAPLASSWPRLREPVRGRGSPRGGGSSRASPR